jgi:hypothetical protein
VRVVEFHPATKAEVRRAVRRYRKVADAELARDFKAKLDDAADRVAKHGHSLAVAHVVDGFEMRRCRFKRFPFTLVYFDDGEKFIVIAVAHNKRRALYWRDRLPTESTS